MLVGEFSVGVWVIVLTIRIAVFMGVRMSLVVLLFLGVQMCRSHMVIITFLPVALKN